MVLLYYVLFIIILLFGLYFLITGMWAFIKNKHKIGNYESKNKFAVLVAARNEEIVIGTLVESLKKQNYPKDLYDIIVLVNNSDDNTDVAAKKAGAIVVNVKAKVKSKGDVLKYAFNKYKNSDYDAYVVFDADNVVHPNFLSRMNDAIEAGYEVAEGFRDSKNLDDNWLSGSYSLFYYIQNFFFNRSRMNVGLSSSINGTGFMVKRETINRNGFEPVTLTEDIEFTAMCALNHTKIAFVEDAYTYDEQPIAFKDSWKQRKRWSTGCIQCMKHYNLKLIKEFFKTGSVSCLDMFLVFLAPVFQVVGFIQVIILNIFHFSGIRLYDIFSYLFASGILFFFLLYTSGILISLFVLIYNRKKLKKVISGVAMFAVFILSWIPINIVCLVKRNIKWEPIKHNRDVELQSLISEK